MHFRKRKPVPFFCLCICIRFVMNERTSSAIGRGAKYCDKRFCLSVCLLPYLRNNNTNFIRRSAYLPVVVAGSSAGGVAILYVFPFCGLRHVIGQASTQSDVAGASWIWYRGVLLNWLTRGSTGPGAESAVYDGLVIVTGVCNGRPGVWRQRGLVPGETRLPGWPNRRQVRQVSHGQLASSSQHEGRDHRLSGSVGQIIIITIPRQLLWCCDDGQSHCDSSPGSFDECRLSANPQTTPTDMGCESAVGCHPHHHRHLLLLLIPKADTRFTFPWTVEGWVDLGTVVKVRSPCPKLYIAAVVAINTSVCGEIRTWVLSHRSRTR